MRIAALDDDALQLDLFKQALHARGHSCHTYLTGAQLLYSLQSERFDLLIVDWHLPDTTGPEVVRWVRQHVGLEMPILFVTHRQEERDIVEGLGCGADDFMTKPVRIGELRARVAALLRRSYTDKPEEVLEFGRYRFLPESRSLEIDGTPVERVHDDWRWNRVAIDPRPVTMAASVAGQLTACPVPPTFTNDDPQDTTLWLWTAG